MRTTHQSSAVRLDTGSTTMSETPIFLHRGPDATLQETAHDFEEDGVLLGGPGIVDLRVDLVSQTQQNQPSHRPDN